MRRLALTSLLAVLVLPATASAHPGPRARAAGTVAPWTSSFERGVQEWSWWGQGQKQIWGHVSAVDPRKYGIPRRQGRRVGRFEVTPADLRAGRTNAKLYEFFQRRGHAPADVSGTYSAWYYYPRSYHVSPNVSNMPFQFKEEYTDASGWHQDPMWWVEIDSAGQWGMGGRASRPVAFLHYPQNRTYDPVPVPLGRWFQIKAQIVEHRRIDVWMDGKHLDTGRQSQWPVGPSHGRHSLKWIFGVGNYSGEANGPLYIDEAAYRPSRG